MPRTSGNPSAVFVRQFFTNIRGRLADGSAQEILREVNTIGSKSGDVAITKSVIALKSDVDRLKEQVANLE